MKKIYSMITMLAMMLVLSSSTCSGSSDDDEINGGSAPSSSFSITYDGKKNDVELTQWINPIFGNGGSKKGNYFCFDNYPLPSGQIHIIFPYSQYGENVQPSHFPVGFSDFGEDATDIEYISLEFSGWYGDYVSGSAKVTANDGKYITIQFSNYAFEVKRNSKVHTFVLNGSLKFQAYLYQ